MSELKPCPFCRGGADLEEIPPNPFIDNDLCTHYSVGCKACNIGWYMDSEAEAVAAWNRRAQPANEPKVVEIDQVKNEPLTLEELRGMDGEPIKIDDDGAILYGLVSLSGNCFTHDEVIELCSGNFYQFADISGNVRVYPLAYRRKPEPEGSENDA